MKCKCGIELQVREVTPGMRVFGHVVNPANRHHYPSVDRGSASTSAGRSVRVPPRRSDRPAAAGAASSSATG